MTLTTDLDSITVLCEPFIDFQNIKDNGFDLLADVTNQGWENYFNLLNGPVLPHLMKYFWIHAKSSTFQVVSFVKGKKVIINEQIIAKVLNLDGKGIRCYEENSQW